MNSKNVREYYGYDVFQSQWLRMRSYIRRITSYVLMTGLDSFISKFSLIIFMEGYVYIIGSPIFRWYKIGKSKTPDVRIKHLGILLPFKIHIIGIWRAQNHHLMESSLHDIYRNNRINGEWFEFTRPEIDNVINSIPIETRIFPTENINQVLDNFSNVEIDTINNKRVIGVRVQKLRGEFTLEEREQIKQERILLKHQRKQERLDNNKVDITYIHPNGDITHRLAIQANKRQEYQTKTTGNIDTTAALMIEALEEIKRLRQN